MADGHCSDVVRFGGDLGLAPDPLRRGLADHVAQCPDCASYVSQVATTRELLGRHPSRGRLVTNSTDDQMSETTAMAPTDVQAVRNALLARAELLDPAHAEDLVQQSLDIGLALQRRDSRPRGIPELSTIMHTLSDAQVRLADRTIPAVDVTAAARNRADSLEDLDSDADAAELFYPDLYPGEGDLDGWVDSPGQWPDSAQILGPEETEETNEVYGVLDQALDELPEPLGDLLALVDVQGQALASSAQELGLDELSATAALTRARNHVRGRLDAYLSDPGR